MAESGTSAGGGNAPGDSESPSLCCAQYEQELKALIAVKNSHRTVLTRKSIITIAMAQLEKVRKILETKGRILGSIKNMNAVNK